MIAARPASLRLSASSRAACERDVPRTAESATAESRKRRALRSYVLCGAVNGMLVGGIGPCLEDIGDDTGLDAKGQSILILTNRLAKLYGLFAWTGVAILVRRCKARGQPPTIAPHQLLAISMAMACAANCALYQVRGSARVVQAALALLGVSYGITDSGMTLLTMWALTDGTAQRTAIAMLNAGFSVGATLAPLCVALSLKTFGTPYLSFAASAGLALAAAIAVLCSGSAASTMATVPVYNSRSVATENLAAATPGQPAYSRLFIAGMSLVLFLVTGTEHAVGTWLPSFGHAAGVPREMMALVIMGFWLGILCGRLAWAGLSSRLSSGWPVLAASLTIVVASLGVVWYFLAAAPVPLAVLWIGTIGISIGYAPAIPCSYSLPAEASVQSTPLRVLSLNLGGSAGETAVPVLLGLVFEAGAGAFGMTILLPALALLVLGLLWIVVYCGRAERAGAHHPAPGSWTWSASKSCAVMQELSKAKGREAAIVCSSGSCDAASSQGLALSLPI